MNQEFAGYSITRSMSGGGLTKLYVAIDAQQTRFVIRVLDAVMAKDGRAKKRFFHGGEVLALEGFETRVWVASKVLEAGS